MTQAESFPIIQKKNLKDKNELAILTCSKGFPQTESQAFISLQGDTTHVPAHQVLCGQGQLRTQEALSHCRKQLILHQPSTVYWDSYITDWC